MMTPYIVQLVTGVGLMWLCGCWSTIIIFVAVDVVALKVASPAAPLLLADAAVLSAAGVSH